MQTLKAKASPKVDPRNKGKDPLKPVKVEKDLFDLSQHESKGMQRYTAC